MKKKKTTWIRKRHKWFVRIVCKGILRPFLIPHYVKIEKQKKYVKPGIVLYNHVTGIDQYMLQMLFKNNVYFVATEDIFSNGFVSKLLRYFVGAISKTKSLPDLISVKNCLQVVKEGGLIAIAPEGNRTYSGALCNIDPSIIKLIRKSRAELTIVNIEKGYSMMPRWADKKAKTKNCRIFVKKRYTVEELENINDEELYDNIINDLNVHEFDTPSHSKSKHRAEYVERMLYVCPECGAISTIRSKGEHIHCDACGMDYIYNENLELVPSVKSNVSSLLDWHNFQEKRIINQDINEYEDYIFNDDEIIFKQVIINKKKVKLLEGSMRMNKDYIEFKSKKQNKPNKQTIIFNLKDIISFTCVGKNKLNFYISNREIYQIEGNKRFNPVKYMHLFYKQLNVRKGDEHNEFLGI